MNYVLIDIGCIECGESSALIASSGNSEVLEEAAKYLNQNFGFTGGQHSYEVFEVPSVDYFDDDISDPGLRDIFSDQLKGATTK